MYQTDALADLRARFIARSRERVQSLRRLIDAGLEQQAGHDVGTDEVSVAAAVARLAHQLAGAAGTFGYAALGEAAAALEDRARAARDDASTFDPMPLTPSLQALEARMAELEANAARETDSPCSAMPEAAAPLHHLAIRRSPGRPAIHSSELTSTPTSPT